MLRHVPVLLEEAIDLLQINPKGIYVDLTLGRSGHAQAIVKKLTTGQLIGLDKDETAIKHAQTVFSKKANVTILQTDFRDLAAVLGNLGITKVDGIIADLGVSSPQLDDPSRGFSYHSDGPLDMRMNQSQTVSALTLVNSASATELAHIFWKYGELKNGSVLAKAIIGARPLATTTDLVDAIRKAFSAAALRDKHPGKQVFQALRIAVNDELGALEAVLSTAPHLLKPGGRLVMITFHSLEDKLVRNAFAPLIKRATGKLPVIEVINWKVKVKQPTAAEIKDNPRARSAKLRALINLTKE